MIEKYSKKSLCLVLTRIKKVFIQKFLALLFFYTRQLNFLSKCRQMNKLHCGIIKIRD